MAAPSESLDLAPAHPIELSDPDARGNERESVKSDQAREKWLFDRVFAHPLTVPVLYLLVLAVAEFLTAAVNPRIGLPLHAAVLCLLLYQGSQTSDESRQALIWALAVAPLIRILSLSLPLVGLPLVAWYALISVPVFAAAFSAARAIGYSRRDLGLVLRWRSVPGYLAMLALGLALGVVEYSILQPRPLSRSLSLAEIWLPALVLSISTGLEEELIFRGLLQRAAISALGKVVGILFVSALFAVLHIGYLSVVDLLFVFTVGLFFAIVALRTRSIVGPTFAHAGVNIGLFVVWPFLLPLVLGGR